MKATNNQIRDFKKQLKKTASKLFADIIAEIMNNPDWLAGDDYTRIRFAAGAMDSLLKAYEQSGYKDIVKELTDRNPELMRDVRAINSINGISTMKGIDFAMRVIEKQQLSALALVDLASFEAIGDKAIIGVHQVLMESALTGISDREMIKQIKELVGDKFERYAKTYAQTSRQRYLQEAENVLAKQFKADGIEFYWEYSGVEDYKNRDQCIEALDQRFFTDEEMQDFEAEGIRWNCRHIFVMVTPEAYETKDKPENDLPQEEKDRRQQLAAEMRK